MSIESPILGRDQRFHEVQGCVEDKDRLVGLAYGQFGHNARILIALRDDALPKLDELKRRIPIIFRTTFRLLPLTEKQARDAITLPPQRLAELGGESFRFDNEAVEGILKFLKGRSEAASDVAEHDIEPLQLQILCEDIERKRKQKAVILGVDLGGYEGLDRIIENYYKRVMRQLPVVRGGRNSRGWWPSFSNCILVNFPRSAAYVLCERGLITPLGQRNMLDAGSIETKYGVPKKDLTQLVNSYLLRSEPRRQSTYYELSHDSLVRAGPGFLNRFSASIGGASAGVRLPSGLAAR